MCLTLNGNKGFQVIGKANLVIWIQTMIKPIMAEISVFSICTEDQKVHIANINDTPGMGQTNDKDVDAAADIADKHDSNIQATLAQATVNGVCVVHKLNLGYCRDKAFWSFWFRFTENRLVLPSRLHCWPQYLETSTLSIKISCCFRLAFRSFWFMFTENRLCGHLDCTVGPNILKPP